MISTPFVPLIVAFDRCFLIIIRLRLGAPLFMPPAVTFYCRKTSRRGTRHYLN